MATIYDNIIDKSQVHEVIENIVHEGTQETIKYVRNGALNVNITSHRPKRNPMKQLPRLFRDAARATLEECADEICDIERHLLKNSSSGKSHIDTGALYESIHRSDAIYKKGTVSISGYADAKNGKVQYEEFIEHGSGKYRDDGTGRQTPWVYYSKNHSRDQVSTMMVDGEPVEVHTENHFFTTEGMPPDPFIAPALEQVIPEVEARFRANVELAFRTNKFGIRHK